MSLPGRDLLLRSDTAPHHDIGVSGECLCLIFSVSCRLSRPQMSTGRARNTAARRGGRDERQ